MRAKLSGHRRVPPSCAAQPGAIIMVTAKGGRDLHRLGLEVGADDYVTKPYRLRELVARMRRCCAGLLVIARRRSGEVLEVGDVGSTRTHEVRDPGRSRQLPLKEFELLDCCSTMRGGC